jgi:hypothetical protein
MQSEMRHHKIRAGLGRRKHKNKGKHKQSEVRFAAQRAADPLSPHNTKPHGTMIKDIPRLQQAASRTH